jgi:hypothetical protein
MERTIRTSVVVPERVWRMLRALAEAKALQAGGRPSASAIVAELVEQASEEKPRAR